MANDKCNNEECKNDEWGTLDSDNTNCNNNNNNNTDNNSHGASNFLNEPMILHLTPQQQTMQVFSSPVVQQDISDILCCR